MQGGTMNLLDSIRGALGKRRSEERRWDAPATDTAAAEVEGASELASTATDAAGGAAEAPADSAQDALDASKDVAEGRSPDRGAGE